ncbi:MAG TPA: hypothetical protein PKC39_01635 [Ferruginibacter sp.]|nr:hypothetical protein [Ferruginibacter sp.]HMP19636.1 hypothetical protein [Ferruginibacter sp.]
MQQNFLIAIHHSKDSYSSRWIEYCTEQKIPFKLVNCYSDSIIEELSDCSALMWHHSHINPRDIIFAKQLLFSLQQAGVRVFPDFNTGWHFNDKLGQKYLLEKLQIPHARTYAFFSKKDANQWIAKTSFPKVFKLRTGASSANVKLVHSKKQAELIVHKAFSKGFSQYDGYSSLKERYRKYKLGLTGFNDILRGIGRLLLPPLSSITAGRERGYVYFQDFIAGNHYDIRVMVIGEKAYAIKRMVRENDFRASGSGFIIYDKDEINLDAIRLAFKAAKKIKSQCIAFDIVFKAGEPLILEISYGVLTSGYDKCPGYWDSALNWYEVKFNPYGWMIEQLFRV